MGPDGDSAFDVLDGVDVAYNPNMNEYLVVWNADDNIGMGDDEFEVFGQRIRREAQAIPVGANDVRLTDVGPSETLGYDASHPRVVYNSVRDVYLIVWYGDDDSSGSVNDEFEIFAQWLTPELCNQRHPITRVLTAMGPPANISYAAERPEANHQSSKLGMHSLSGVAIQIQTAWSMTKFEIYGTVQWSSSTARFICRLLLERNDLICAGE